MTTKEYLSQTWQVNRLIDAKIEQVGELRELATKATTTLSDTPRPASPNIHRMEDIIAKIVDLENEINGDIDELLETKKRVADVIKRVKDPEQQSVLEMRYLCYQPWETIAARLAYSPQHTFRIHGSAISSVARELESKCD